MPVGRELSLEEDLVVGLGIASHTNGPSIRVIPIDSTSPDDKLICAIVGCFHEEELILVAKVERFRGVGQQGEMQRLHAGERWFIGLGHKFCTSDTDLLPASFRFKNRFVAYRDFHWFCVRHQVVLDWGYEKMAKAVTKGTHI